MVRCKTLIPAITMASFLAFGVTESTRADDTTFLDCDSVFGDTLCDSTACDNAGCDGAGCDGLGCLGGCGLGSA